jgi:hypothetical protein
MKLLYFSQKKNDRVVDFEGLRNKLGKTVHYGKFLASEETAYDWVYSDSNQGGNNALTKDPAVRHPKVLNKLRLLLGGTSSQTTADSSAALPSAGQAKLVVTQFKSLYEGHCTNTAVANLDACSLNRGSLVSALGLIGDFNNDHVLGGVIDLPYFELGQVNAFMAEMYKQDPLNNAWCDELFSDDKFSALWQHLTSSVGEESMKGTKWLIFGSTSQVCSFVSLLCAFAILSFGFLNSLVRFTPC